MSQKRIWQSSTAKKNNGSLSGRFKQKFLVANERITYAYLNRSGKVAAKGRHVPLVKFMGIK
jgi:hypothetical protein